MLHEAYDQGCEIALNELAETYGEDLVVELVKIAKDKEREYIGAGVGGATGAGLAGYGGYRGGKHLAGKLTPEAIKKHLLEYEKKISKPMSQSPAGKIMRTRDEIKALKNSRSKWLLRGAAHGGKVGAGLGALAGAAGLGYAGKKLAE